MQNWISCIRGNSRVFLLAAFVAVLGGLWSIQPVQAQQNQRVFLPALSVDALPPASSPSYYAKNLTTSDWYAHGHALGVTDSVGFHDRLVLLAFGYPVRSGSSTYGVQLPFDQSATFHTVTEVREAVREFARGYWEGTGTNLAPQLRIVVGTNNCCTGVSLSIFQGHGSAWAQMMNELATATASYASQVTVVAGSDMELEFNNPYTTVQWISTFMTARQCTPGADDTGCLFNFGNQTVSVPTGQQGTCNYTNPSATTWNACDVWYISWGAKRSGDTNPYIRALPEIYHAPNPPSNPYGTDALAWAQLSRYSYDFRASLPSSGPIGFAGSLTQFARCGPVCLLPGGGSYNNNSPAQGWNALTSALRNKLGASQYVRWSTDIGLQPVP